MGFPKEDNENKINYDLPFFINILKKNGFAVNKKEIKIDKHLLNVIIEESYSLFDNSVLNILFIYTNKIYKKSIIKAARDFVKKDHSILCLFSQIAVLPQVMTFHNN
ncbi:MAG: hypothetical protein RXP28_07415 [Nitrososphaeria archaeon]